MGTFASARDLYEQCLQLWVLQQCAGQHKKFPRIGVVPAQQHQRLAYVEMALPSSVYYASVGASGVFGTGIFWGQQGFGGNGGNTPSYPSGTSSSGSLEFNCYRHEEDWTSTYNTQLTKYDHETGETLEGSSFRLYERFDDKDQVNLERDGAVELYGGTDHETYLSKYLDNPVVWDDYRFVATITTNEEGYASNTVEHKYHYDKTFCDGHPAPAFVEVPEEEEDEEGEVTNQDEIDEAKEENRRLASGWLECFDACDETASAGTYEGVHFHWLMSEVSQGEISSIASSGGEEGSTPNAGPTSSASGEDSYVNSGCKQDAEATYNKFIALKYSYTYQESGTRFAVVHSLDGYDEISLTAEFKVAMPEKEKLYTPEMLGFSRTTEAELDGGETVAEAARIFDDVLNNRATPAQKNCVIANSAFAIQVICPEKRISECLEEAQEALESGKALQTFNTFISLNDKLQ